MPNNKIKPKKKQTYRVTYEVPGQPAKDFTNGFVAAAGMPPIVLEFGPGGMTAAFGLGNPFWTFDKPGCIKIEVKQ